MGIFREMFGSVDRATAEEYVELSVERTDRCLTDDEQDRLDHLERTIPGGVRRDLQEWVRWSA